MVFSLALGRHLVVSFIVFFSAAEVKQAKGGASPGDLGLPPGGRLH